MEKGITLDQLNIGQTYESKVTITEDMIKRFAEATGDYNPIHLNEDYAKGTIFKTRVAHGMLQAGIISGILGTRFPGVGTIYLSQTMRFLKPVFIGDEVTSSLKVLELITEKNRVRLETVCTNQRGETVLSGEALVMPPS
ncbi:MAG: MaoC family dehydratase [Chloroflexi bacterium]|nr:MaoC family dehydratase [Chloroflexota bacterium]MBM4454383.1 MaoC family dehydratase [Chloroflexota bacterium]